MLYSIYYMGELIHRVPLCQVRQEIIILFIRLFAEASHYRRWGSSFNATGIWYDGPDLDPFLIALHLANIEIQAENWQGKRCPGYDRIILHKPGGFNVFQKHAARKKGILC